MAEQKELASSPIADPELSSSPVDDQEPDSPADDPEPDSPVDEKLSAETKARIDDKIRQLPLFLPCQDRDLCELRVRPDQAADFHYELPDTEFDYWCEYCSHQLRVVHLDRLKRWLADHGVSPDVISLIPEDAPKDSESLKQAEQDEIALFTRLGGSSS
jgi:hypothetical protein